LKYKQRFRAKLSMKKLAIEKKHIFTTTVTTRGLYKYLNAHKNSVKKRIQLCFHNLSKSITILDLYKYTFDTKHVRMAYACINENIKLYDVTYDSLNKTVSAKEFEALLDSETNITEIIYYGSKQISGFGIVYNIQSCSYEYGQFKMKF
ncbi:1866_t:CDS:1, partial [Gigaspora margarita]